MPVAEIVGWGERKALQSFLYLSPNLVWREIDKTK